MDVLLDNITAVIALISFVAGTIGWFIRTELKMMAFNKRGCYATTEDVKDIAGKLNDKLKAEIDKELTEIKDMLKEERAAREKLQDKLWNGK